MAEERAKVNPSLPYQIGAGIRQTVQDVEPISAAFVEAAALPARAVWHGASELVGGLRGQAPTKFETAPLTNYLAEIARPPMREVGTPVDMRTVQPTMNSQYIEREISPQRQVIAPTEAPMSQSIASTPEQSKGGVRQPMQIYGGIPIPEEPIFMRPRLENYGSVREFMAANQAIANYNKALVDRYAADQAFYGQRVGGIPKKKAEAELARVQAAEFPRTSESERSLRSAQAAAAGIRTPRQQGLIKINVPTGEVDDLTGQPFTTEMLYDPNTRQTIRPQAPTQQPPEAVANLRSSFASLPISKRSIAEKYFADNPDISIDAAITFMNQLSGE